MMTITEIALLRLSPSVTIDDTQLRSKLAHAKRVMQNYTRRTFYYFQQVEEPPCIYVFGEWESLDQHINHFIPSQENQMLLESLKDALTVEWLLHIDAPHASLPLPKTEAEKDKACRGGQVISIERHFIKASEKRRFQETFEANKYRLQDYVTEGTIGGGWRVDTQDDQEWVFLCPFTSVQQHHDFVATESFEKYNQIREHIAGVDIKHAKLLDI